MREIKFELSSGNVFLDIGFSPEEAALLLAKAKLTVAIKDVIKARRLTQRQAASICGTDQRTLSNVFRAGNDDVTIDRLVAWLAALGYYVDFVLTPAASLDRGGPLPGVAAG